MRRIIKRLLREYQYPPEGYEMAVETVMRQCERWADDEENLVWTSDYHQLPPDEAILRRAFLYDYLEGKKGLIEERTYRKEAA